MADRSVLPRAAREVGGDFYDFFDLEEYRVGLVVRDATGKGVPAALVVAATCNMLIATVKSIDPAAIMKQAASGRFQR